MEKDLIEIMKKTGRLKLSFWANVTHYMIVLFLFMPLIFVLFDLVTYSYSGVRTPPEMLQFSIPFALIGILFAVIQYLRLRFKIVQTNMTKARLIEIIDKTADELEWIKLIKDKDLIVFKTNPKWWTGSWGEQITILIDTDRIFVNSICDPDNRVSVVSAGRNKKHTNRLIENIKNASR
jgi:hypothetical protein